MADLDHDEQINDLLGKFLGSGYNIYYFPNSRAATVKTTPFAFAQYEKPGTQSTSFYSEIYYVILEGDTREEVTAMKEELFKRNPGGTSEHKADRSYLYTLELEASTDIIGYDYE